MQTYDDDVRLAHVVVDAADAVTLGRFNSGNLSVSIKRDGTPVTDVDEATEQAVRSVLRRARPRDSVLGEEFGTQPPEHGAGSAATAGVPGTAGSRCWVVDPIDGTKNYLRGVPVWATLLALLDGPEVVAAVVSAPALNRRWWAGRGAGAWTGRSLSKATPCKVSSVSTLEEASLSYGGLHSWVKHDRFAQFLNLTRPCWRTRAYGDFWSYMLLAEGGVDVALQPEGALHDFAAISLIVEEAGGRFTDLDDQPGPAGGSALATNGLLHPLAATLIARH